MSALAGELAMVSLLAVPSSGAATLSGTAAAAFSVGVGVGLGTDATTLPTAVVVIESAEFCPTAAGLPPHPASVVRITPTNSTRFMPISLIGDNRHPIRQRGQGATRLVTRATVPP
jgi:hypothetical protein